MQNNQTIILNCFSRGGSNILWNIFLSHPDVCSPIQETLEIFRISFRDIRWAGIKAAWMTKQPSFFNQWNFDQRRPISIQAQKFIDDELQKWKMKTLNDLEMKYKAKGMLYSHDEVENSRLAMKNNNGTIFLSNCFQKMYPDAISFGLVREPLSLYESHKRHRTPVSKSPQAFAKFYRMMVLKMTSDAKKCGLYHLLWFEDILADPQNSISLIYEAANLDMAKTPKMRFKAKRHFQENGSHSSPFEIGRHYWFSMKDLSKILEPKVNQYQTSRLSPHEIDQIKKLTKGTINQLKAACFLK